MMTHASKEVWDKPKIPPDPRTTPGPFYCIDWNQKVCTSILEKSANQYFALYLHVLSL